jgi:glycosyltransferase involved in cell wall biosynthesis
MKRVTIVEVNKVTDFPPVQNVIRALIQEGCQVNLISRAIKYLPSQITDSPNFKGFEIPWIEETNIINKFRHRIILNKYVREQTKRCMENSDFLWTTSIVTIRELRKDIRNYRHIFQLMELTRYGYLTALQIKYSLAEIAQNAYKVVTPEVNRAYIEKVWWNLEKVPTVLPNKPFDLVPGSITEEMLSPIEKIKNEKRKVILYLGGIFSDRNLETIAMALKTRNDYVLYIVGKVYSKEGQEKIDYLQKNYPVEYLGGFNPPSHLNFLKYAYMGVLPYKPVKSQSSDELNALYCAPNKIFEYAGFGVPMIGSDVMGLKLPFEQWNIGCCYDDNSIESIMDAIDYVEKKYETMTEQCIEFYNSVDLNKIICGIIGGHYEN